MVNSYASRLVSVFETSFNSGTWVVLVHNSPSESKTFDGQDSQARAVQYAGLLDLDVYASSVVPVVDYQVVS
jgi:hypothetical protein